MELEQLWEILKRKGMSADDIPEQKRTHHIPMEHGWVDSETVDASEFEIRIWPNQTRDWACPVVYVWEIHRNGLWIGNSETMSIDGALAYGEYDSAQAAAQEYIDRVVKFGVNHETS